MVEVYLNDCYDLLNGKGKIPIAGMKAKVSTKVGAHIGVELERDANGKWIPPFLDGKKNDKTS